MIKRTILLSLTVLFLVGCSKDEITNHHYYVDTVEVTLNTQRLITEVESFSRAEKMASTMNTTSLDTSYEHHLPQVFTAYFIADETKGQYTEGQLVKELEVSTGSNTLTVPQMALRVVVTNFNGTFTHKDWYMWEDALEQLPRTSKELYLLGNNTIDYEEVTEGSVTLYNPYAAVMVYNNQWVAGTPSSYDTSENYEAVSSTWYNLYIRSSNTNSQIPIDIPGNYNNHYDLMRDIDPNKIYQYTLNGSVLDGSGNLSVVVKPLEEGYAEEIQL